MAYTQTDLDNLNAAIVGAELEVEYQGRRVRFRSVKELQAAYEHVKAELAAQATASAPRTSYGYTFTTLRGD
jgi:hypothetical protein